MNTLRRCSFPDGGRNSNNQNSSKKKHQDVGLLCPYVPMTYIFCEIVQCFAFCFGPYPGEDVRSSAIPLIRKEMAADSGGSSMLVLKTGFGHWLSCGKAENRPSGNETPTTHLMDNIGSYWGYLGLVYYVYYWGYQIWNGLSRPKKKVWQTGRNMRI